MQGMLRVNSFVLLLISFLSACTTVSQPYESAPLAVQPMVDHCSVGCPAGGSALTLNRQAYSLNNNGITRFANWVAYRITNDTPASARPRNWQADPAIAVGETLVPSDYNGANTALKVDRGHQANLASMGGVEDWQALNYLSNITPQKSDLNQGAWAALEEQERRLGRDSNIDQVHVLTGPLYERYMGTLPAATTPHIIPSGYWKIIFVGKTPENGLYAAFVMDQETPRSANYCHYQTTVDQIERRSGLTVWSNLPSSVQANLKSAPGQLAGRVGC
ncbi:DNA/RNA non-specific endonuclease [Pseudomonas turukhanskensis]|uniref:Endonuclease n=1 Tax=Pseudomonas turukhanskensis TaxID=1806536 RepID=A0A9W6K870_9PSED|nr:DNA/RNA non-specific endonuclease [Pseudomonas turukhanskensis]GLK91320.1 endonuclease [Pseudomonas turukhanskensis]